jgi:hypothetical protein
MDEAGLIGQAGSKDDAGPKEDAGPKDDAAPRHEAAPRARWKLPPAVTYALIAAWIAVALLGISSLAVPHMAAMPQAEGQARTIRALLELRRADSRRFVVHVIYRGCSCTERLFAHLVSRGAFADAEELVLFVGDDDAKRKAATGAGYRYVAVSAPELAERFGLEAAPVLFTFDASARLRYAGGYFDHPSTQTSLDESIYARVAAGEAPKALPIFGCAVSPRLQDSVDPLGIVYRRN